MHVSKARLLSWLVDVICYGSIVFVIYFLCYSYIELATLARIRELPHAKLYAIVRSVVFQDSLPESWNGPYIYLPNNKWIRLCKIVIAGDGRLYFPLERFLLEAAPPYRALSYTWGPAEGGPVPHDGDRINMTLSGRDISRTLPLNLVSAALNLRSRNLSEYYWIDAICIDQIDDKERSEQVNIMDKIFQRATAVDVWLGKAYPDTQKINDIVHELVLLHEQVQQLPTNETAPVRPTWFVGEHILLPDDWETLVQIISRRWFHRLWTLQEFALAKEVNMLCGNVTINLSDLHKAMQLLSDYQIPMKLSYGNDKRIGSATVLQLSSLQQAVFSHQSLQFEFLKCFQGLDSSLQIDYESLLVLVFWRSMASFSTDPRDYVFGITGVANAIANKMGLEYEPFRTNYSLSTAEAFQAFVVRVMNGSFGIRAISLTRQSSMFVVRHSTDVVTAGLPSWVPDLANRDWYGLSTNGGLKPLEATCQNVLGPSYATARRPLSTVSGSALHMNAHRIGKVLSSSRIFPIEAGVEACSNFPLSLTPLLNQLPLGYPGTNETPIEALLHTLRLDSDSSTSPYAPNPIKALAYERYLSQALRLFIWNKASPPQNQSVQQTMSWLTQGGGHDVWAIQGLSEDFPSPSALASPATLHQLGWLLKSGNLTDDVIEMARNMVDSCRTFCRAYGARIAATKLFLVELEGNNSLMPLQLPSEKTLLLGLGSDTLAAGDEVWAAAGAEWPLILRPHVLEDGNVYRDKDGVVLDPFFFKGEAYVHGIMHGELFESREPEWKEVVLD